MFKGLLRPIATVEPQGHGLRAPDRGPCALNLVPLLAQYLCGSKMDSNDGLANSNTSEDDRSSVFSVKSYFPSVLPAALNFRHLSRNANNPSISIGFCGGPSTRGRAYPNSIAAPVAVPVMSVDK